MALPQDGEPKYSKNEREPKQESKRQLRVIRHGRVITRHKNRDVRRRKNDDSNTLYYVFTLQWQLLKPNLVGSCRHR